MSAQPVAKLVEAPAEHRAMRSISVWATAVRYRSALLLMAIVGLGLGLRLAQLGEVPAGFFADEASIGYNAYTILTRGTDEYSVPHPLFFRAFGEYKGPIEIYSTVPFVRIFGLNETAVRLPSALYGTLCVVAMFLLVRQLFKASPHRDTLALLSALLLAISPWHIHFSRVALEGLTPWIFFSTMGLYLFLKAQDQPKLLPAAMVAFTLALYSYFPARLFIPLLGIGLFCFNARFFFKHKREMWLSALTLVALLIPFVVNLFSNGGFSRWQQVSIFDHPPKDQPVWQHIAYSYFSHFSYEFLFTKGDIDMPGQFITRHSVRGMGELYLFQLPLCVLGLAYIVYLARRKTFAPLTIVLWLILYPVGSMFTTDQSAQATRSVIGVVPWQIVSALGIVALFQAAPWVARRVRLPELTPTLRVAVSGAAITLISAVAWVSFANYASLYFGSYNSYSSNFWGWQFGARDIIAYFVRHETEYDELIMAPEFNGPDIFPKFYAPNTCGKCKIGLPDNSFHPGLRQLFAVTPDYASSYKGTLRTISTIPGPSGGTAFLLVEVVSPSS